MRGWTQADIDKIKSQKKPAFKKDSSYMRTCDEIFMRQFRGKPCEVCASQKKLNTYRTCGHHIIPKSLSKYLRFARRNIAIVCPGHHQYGRDICAHGTNCLSVGKFSDWLIETRPEDYEFLILHQHDPCPDKYKDMLEIIRRTGEVER